MQIEKQLHWTFYIIIVDASCIECQIFLQYYHVQMFYIIILMAQLIFRSVSSLIFYHILYIKIIFFFMFIICYIFNL